MTNRHRSLLLGSIVATALSSSGAFALDTVKDFSDLGRMVAVGSKASGLSDAISFGFTDDTFKVTVSDTQALREHAAMSNVDIQDLGADWLEFELTSEDFAVALHGIGLKHDRPLTSLDMALFVENFQQSLGKKPAIPAASPLGRALASISAGWHDFVLKGKHALQGGTGSGIAFGAA
jgi:hypothetical protein